MFLLLLSMLIIAVGGSISYCLGYRKSALIGPAAAILGCLLALYPTLSVLLGFSEPIYYISNYTLPIGRIILRLDPMAAIFLVPTLIVAAFCAFYGMSYLGRGLSTKKNFGNHWFFYSLLVFGLILTFIAADTFLFMLGWEIMSISPFFLVIFKHEDDQVRKGATSYLIAAHLGALFLLAFFLLLANKNGGALDFAAFEQSAPHLKAGGLLFIFALIGFGTKAGLVPMHIWLPEAHPAAPGHISAVMSGVMINTGIYGIIRSLTFLGASQTWWAFTLICVGAVSAALGIFFALSKESIKRSLAFSSIENMGLVCMALGFALYSAQCGNAALALLCALGGLLHLFNHSFYKSLLFLVAAATAKETGTDILNRLGGLQKRVPFLGFCFFVGAAAICALPPLNGFAGKIIMYVTFAAGGSVAEQAGFLYWAAFVILAGVSGFSLFCFTRLFGLAFLGAPRSPEAAEIESPPRLEKYTLLFVAALCFILAMLAPYLARLFSTPLAQYIAALQAAAGSGLPGTAADASLPVTADDLYGLLLYVNFGFIAFAALAFGLYLWRKHALRSKSVGASPTWDCGYARPSPRMQYTAGSFSQPAIYYTGFVLHARAVVAHFAGFFPSSGKAELSTDDWIKSSVYSKIFLLIARVAIWAKSLQHGRTNTYILYIFITLVALLAWKIR